MGEYIEVVARDGGRFSAYLARPVTPGPAPALVVAQEIFGINANIRATADRFASEGYLAVAPDVFWRQEPGLELNPASEADRGRAMQLLQNLDEAAAVSDVLAAADHLKGLAGCNGRAGVVGYCMGGKLAYLAAMEGADAAVSYYGVGIQGALDRAPRIRAAVLLHLAEEDALCPPEAQARISAAFEGSAQVRIISHPGVGHAFARLGAPTYVAPTAEAADRETLAFLRAHLVP